MPLKLFTMVCGIVAFYAVIYGQNFAIMVRFKNASLSKNIGLIIAHEETHWYVMSFIKTAQTWSRLMGLKIAPESISVGLRNQTQLGNLRRFHLVYPKVDWGGRYFPSTSILSTSAKPLLVMTAVIWRGGSMPVPSSFIANTQNELCSFYAKIDLI